MVDNIGRANGCDTMFEFLTPFLDEIGLMLATAFVTVVAYAKIAVKNISQDEAEDVALQIVAALGDGVMTAKEKQDVIAKIITCMRSK